MPWNQAIAYLVLCITVGLLGHKRAIGFWGFFVLSLVLTPLLMTLILALTSYRREPAPSR
jgi:hypothetical protein